MRSSNKSVNNMLLSSLIGIILFGMVFVFYYRNEIFSFQFKRLGQLFGDINDISVTFSIGYSIAFYFLFFSKNILFKIFSFFISLFLLFLSFTSGSRIAILLFFVSTIFCIVLFFRKEKWYFSLFFVLGIIGIFVLVISLPPFGFIKERTLNLLYTLIGKSYNNINYDNSSIIRVDMFQNGVSLFLRRPIFGNGVNGFHLLSSWHNGWSHNHYSDSLCNYGIIGTIFYHLPLVFFFKTTKLNKANSLSYILIIFFIFSTFSIALFKEKFFTYLVGIVLASSKEIDFKYNIQIKKIREINHENC